MATLTNRLVVVSPNGDTGRNEPVDTLEVGSSWKTLGTGTFDFGSSGAITSTGTPASFTMGTVGAIALDGGAASHFATSVGALTLTSAAAATWSTSAGALALTGAGGLTLTATTGGAALEAPAGAIDIGSGVVTGAVRIGTGGNRNITIGNNGGASNITLNAGTGSAITASGKLTVTSHLLVQGSTTAIQSDTVRVAANHAYLNDGYTTVVAQTGGIVVNYLPTATTTTVAAGGFTAGVAAVSNPTVATVGAATFAAGDLVQASGTSSVANGGLFEVQSHAANVLTIRGIGTVAATQDWVQTQFATDTTVAGTLTKVAVAIMRANTAGNFQVGKGNSTTGWTFHPLVAGVGDLQASYDLSLPPTITTAAGGGIGQGPVIIAGTESLQVTATGGFSVGSGGSERPVSLSATTATIAATGAVGINSSGGAIGIGTDPVAQNINIGTGGAARTITIGNVTGGTSVVLNAGTGNIDIGTTAQARNVNVGTGGAAQVVTVGATSGASSLTLQSGSQPMAFTAGAGFDVNATGMVTIDSSGGAINIGSDAVSQNINLGTGGNRTITIGNSGGASGISLNAGTSGPVTVSGGLTITSHLLVQGGMTALQSETVRIADNHPYLNDGYTTAVAQTGGLVVNYLPTATTDTVAAGGFTAGVDTVSNPTVATTGAATFAAGDLVQLNGASSVVNGGLFEVQSHAANVLTIRGVGTVATTQDWVQTQFATDAVVAGTLTKVTVAILRAGTTGDWEVGKGSTTTGWVFSAIGGGGGDLQAAYDGSNPPTITTAAGGGLDRVL